MTDTILTAPDVWDMHQVKKALREVKDCEDWLKARAQAAGLQLYSVRIGLGGSPVAIRLEAGRNVFKGDRTRSCKYVTARGVEDFDRLIAEALLYIKRMGNRLA